MNDARLAVLDALKIAHERIECEDYVGTCGCQMRRTGRCPCREDHDEILGKISDAIKLLETGEVK